MAGVDCVLYKLVVLSSMDYWVLTVHQSDSTCAAERNEYCVLGCLRFLVGPEPQRRDGKLTLYYSL
jgi:hypothetical protein